MRALVSLIKLQIGPGTQIYDILRAPPPKKRKADSDV